MSLFARPTALWLLALLPLLIARLALGRRRRSTDWEALGQSGGAPGDRAWSWVLAVACLIVALAQPRWGRSPASTLPPGHDVVLLVDVSRSMGAEDAVPNRLGVAIEAGQSLLGALGKGRGDRAAVVAFEGRGMIRCPLTEDLGAASEALHELRPGTVQPGGTDLAEALDAAVEAFDEPERAQGKSIVLFSDGEDLAGSWSSAIDRLRETGIVVHSVAIGDPAAGHPVPSGRGTEVVTYRGSPVVSRRDDRALRALAKATGGLLIGLGRAPEDLRAVYRARMAPVARLRREEVRPPERVERFPIFVLAGVGFGLAGSRPGIPRRLRPRRWLVGALALAALGAGGDPGTPWSVVEEGRVAFESGRFLEALHAFERAVELDPRAAVPRYNAASALFQLGRYPEAQARYREARERAGPSLRTKIDYTLGNTALAVGDIQDALHHYDACLASTARGPGLDAIRRDAALNRRFAQEQTRPQPMPPDPEGSSAKPSSGRRGPRPAVESGEDPSGSGKGGPPPEPGEGSGSPSPSSRRGAGGAGGTGPSPVEAGSPDQRLASALRTVREARQRRLEDEPPAPDKDRRDW